MAWWAWTRSKGSHKVHEKSSRLDAYLKRRGQPINEAPACGLFPGAEASIRSVLKQADRSMQATVEDHRKAAQQALDETVEVRDSLLRSAAAAEEATAACDLELVFSHSLPTMGSISASAESAVCRIVQWRWHLPVQVNTSRRSRR